MCRVYVRYLCSHLDKLSVRVLLYIGSLLTLEADYAHTAAKAKVSSIHGVFVFWLVRFFGGFHVLCA